MLAIDGGVLLKTAAEPTVAAQPNEQPTLLNAALRRSGGRLAPPPTVKRHITAAPKGRLQYATPSFLL